MRILVTGGAGFIGSHLCDYLLELGHYVVVVDTHTVGSKGNIGHLIGRKDFDFYQEDILNYNHMSKIFIKEKFDVIFHLAANSNIAVSNPHTDYCNTLGTTYNILSLMLEYQVKQIVFSSSSAVYGEVDTIFSEDSPLAPISHYGASKAASEMFIHSFTKNHNMQGWIFRFPNVVGERATHGVIFDFINKLKENPKELEVLGDGKQFKHYMYVKDLIRAMLFIWKNSREKINIYNIGSIGRIEVRDIAKMVIEEMGLNAKIKYVGGDRGWVGDVPEYRYDLSKLSFLGWTPEITSAWSVRKAIRRMLEKE